MSRVFTKEFAEDRIGSLYTCNFGDAFLKIEGAPIHPDDPMVSDVEAQTKAFEDFWYKVIREAD